MTAPGRGRRPALACPRGGPCLMPSTCADVGTCPPAADVGRALAVADPAAVLATLGAKVSPDLDAYASGRLPLSRVRCVLCGAAPCRCRQCAAPYPRYLADAPEPCGMTVRPDGQCPRGHRQDGGAR